MSNLARDGAALAGLGLLVAMVWVWSVIIAAPV